MSGPHVPFGKVLIDLFSVITRALLKIDNTHQAGELLGAN